MWGRARLRNRFAGQKWRHQAWGTHQLFHVTRGRLCIMAARHQDGPHLVRCGAVARQAPGGRDASGG